MADRSILDIILRTKRSGKGEKGVIDDFKKMAAQLAAVAAAAIVVKKAFDFAKEGALIEATEQRFERLAESIGTTGEALRDDLRKETRGLLSDFELVSSATDLMSLGLAKNHDEAVRLANVSAQLGMDMNQLVLTLTNMTTMRFDALGLQVDGFKEKVSALEDAGLSAGDAFKQAFLSQAEDQLKRVGSIADTDAGSFMQMEAAIKDLTDGIKTGLVPVITPMVKLLAEALNRTQDEADAIGDLIRANEIGAISQEELNRAIEEYGNTRDVLPVIDLFNEAMERYNATLNGIIPAGHEAAGIADIVADGMRNIPPSVTSTITVENKDAMKSIEDVLAMLQGLQQGMYGVTIRGTVINEQRSSAAQVRAQGPGGLKLAGLLGGLAGGGSFIVPGSGRGDRPFTLNLEPGERVDVTPRSEVINNDNRFSNANIQFMGSGYEDPMDEFLRRARRS